MQVQALILILLFPFFGALLNGLISLKNPRMSLLISLGSILSAILCVVYCCSVLPEGGSLKYYVGSWKPPYGIEFTADLFHLVLALFVLLIAFCNLLHCSPMLKSLFPRGRQFYSIYLILTVAFVGLIFTADIFNLYVFLEITSLASYALIGRGDGRACRAALNYLLIGTVGASFYLIGVGFLYIKTGTLNLHDLNIMISTQYDSETIRAGFSFILLGLMIKMAVFPLHSWLPNAYSYCPQPSVGLLAPVATKVALFLMFKISFELFPLEYIQQFDGLAYLLVNLMAVGIIILSLLALAQKNWVRAFCYFIVIEVCYIFGGFWLQNKSGLIGASYHIFADMVLTLGIFLFIGTIRLNFRAFVANRLAGLFRQFPLVSVAFLLISLSLIGVPPTAGFVSKFYLLKGAAEQQQWLFFASLLFASLTAVVIIFRIIEAGFFSEPNETLKPHYKNSMALMVSVLSFLAVLLLLLGIYQKPFIASVIIPYLNF